MNQLRMLLSKISYLGKASLSVSAKLQSFSKSRIKCMHASVKRRLISSCCRQRIVIGASLEKASAEIAERKAHIVSPSRSVITSYNAEALRRVERGTSKPEYRDGRFRMMPWDKVTWVPFDDERHFEGKVDRRTPGLEPGMLEEMGFNVICDPGFPEGVVSFVPDDLAEWPHVGRGADSDDADEKGES